MTDKETLVFILITALVLLFNLRLDDFLEFLSRHIENK